MEHSVYIVCTHTYIDWDYYIILKKSVVSWIRQPEGCLAQRSLSCQLSQEEGHTSSLRVLRKMRYVCLRKWNGLVIG